MSTIIKVLLLTVGGTILGIGLGILDEIFYNKNNKK